MICQPPSTCFIDLLTTRSQLRLLTPALFLCGAQNFKSLIRSATKSVIQLILLLPSCEEIFYPSILCTQRNSGTTIPFATIFNHSKQLRSLHKTYFSRNHETFYLPNLGQNHKAVVGDGLAICCGGRDLRGRGCRKVPGSQHYSSQRFGNLSVQQLSIQRHPQIVPHHLRYFSR